MLFTILPPETVWADAAAGAAEPPLLWVVVGPHRLVGLRRDPAGGARIERLVSTEPRDYLNPLLQPGMPFPLPSGAT